MRQDHNHIDSIATGSDAGEPELRRARRIERFCESSHSQLWTLANADPALDDLAESFPALLFALATGYGDRAARTNTTRLVIAGAPLRSAAAALSLPLWLRRLPPEAFSDPLRHVPDGDDFATRVVNLMPSAPVFSGPWLYRTLLAAEVCGTEAALWVARQYKGAGPAPTDPALLHTLAWIWHADRPGTVPQRLLRRRWQPQFSARRAAEEVEHWRHRLALAVALGDGLADTWLSEGHCRGYDFVALRTAEDFIAEAQRMDNCLDQYAHRLEGRAVRVFSIRKDGRSVADVEIACHEQELGMPTIAQLRAPRNRRAAMDVWQATYSWLGSQAIRPADPALLRQDRTASRRATAKLWRPFLETLGDETRSVFAAAFGTRATLRSRRVVTVSPARMRSGSRSVRPKRETAAP